MIGWMQRFAYNCNNSNNKRRGELTAEEVINSEIVLLKIIQLESFSSTEDKQISSLNAFTGEDKLIRLETKVSNREDTSDFRYPIVLPGQHPVIKLLILDLHVSSCHIGVQGLMCILRERYWILGGRRSIRSVLSKCVPCLRHCAKKKETSSPPLPIDRVRNAAVFEVSGVDLTGPVYLRSKDKAWICLFTCSVYRAVHLELISSLSTSSFLQALRRFISRRGRPKIIFSDNATNFVGTDNAFRELNWQTIEQYTAAQRIRWRFSPLTAPWWGGWWERLIGILKRLLRRVLGRAALNYEEFVTVLCDCETVINSRPLTYISDDPNDLMVLTPAMFLRDLSGAEVPDCDEVDSISLNKRMRYKQKLREDLRRRFRTEYLGQLKQISGKKRHNITIGEIVLIGNDNNKRLDWPLGRVVELLPGKDKETRLVRLQTQNGQLLRPIQRLYSLECVESEDSVCAGVNESRVPEK